MKKSTKGAIAAGAAAVLLLGGAGTLAFWTAEDEVDLGAVESGNLQLSLDPCDDWVYEGTTDAVTKIVPGDVIVSSCTGEVTGEGDNLFAEIELDQDSVDATRDLLGPGGTIADEVTITATQTAPATGPIAVTAAGVPIAFSITVDFPYDSSATGGENNDSQDATLAALEDIQVVATQVTGP